MHRQLEEVEATILSDATSAHNFTKVDNFDTDIQSCLSDPKKALSYQTGRCYSLP